MEFRPLSLDNLTVVVHYAGGDSGSVQVELGNLAEGDVRFLSQSEFAVESRC
jgi:hypothetical protein